jgi:hypothetical protein
MHLEVFVLRSALVASLCALMPALGLAQDRRTQAAGSKQSAYIAGRFFYSIPEGVQDEWAYAIPDCPAITQFASRGLHNCAPFEKHQMCESSASVELTNVLTTQSRKFGLLYHVFSTKKACVQDRQRVLRGE